MFSTSEAASKINSIKRCNRNNIVELTAVFRSVNDRVRALLNKILMYGARLEQKESRELQQLLRAQAKLALLRVEPGSGNVERNLFNNQRHRVVRLKEAIKEIERRYQFKILSDY